MAQNYSDIQKLVYTDGNKMDFGNSMIRGNGIPLDVTEVYSSYLDAIRYAATNSLAYEGQLIAVTESGDTTVYVITPAQQGIYEDMSAGTGVADEIPIYIKEVGKAPVGDDATITVVGGRIQLANLTGKTSGTYQPFLVDGEIEWREPSAVTVEGLDGRLETAEDDIEALETTVGDETSGLVKKVADIESDVSDNAEEIAAVKDAYALADTNLKTELQGKIDDALQAAKDYADANDADTVYNDEEVRGLISGNTTEIGKVNDKAVKNAEDIAQEIRDRQSAVSTLESTLKAYVGTEIGKQAHFNAEVVTSTEAMTNDTTLYLIKANEADDAYEEYLRIGGVPTKIGTTTTDLSGYDTSEQVAKKIKDAIDTLDASLTESIQDVSDAVDTVSGDLEDYKTEVGNTYETKEDSAAAIKVVADDLAELTTEVGKKATQDDLSALSETVEGISESVGTNTTDIADLKQADINLAGRIKALEDVGSEKNYISDVTDEFTVTTAGELAINSIESSKVTGLDDALSALRDSVDGKVSKVTSEYKGEQRAWTLLSPEDQEKLAALTFGSESGNLELSAEVEAGKVKGLGTWITGQRDSLNGLLSGAQETKLAGIAENAQVNVLEKVKIVDRDLAISADKSVVIPFATNDLPGVVLGSSSENHVSITVNGTMEVNSLNVNKLTQTDGDTLILNGGNATTV